MIIRNRFKTTINKSYKGVNYVIKFNKITGNYIASIPFSIKLTEESKNLTNVIQQSAKIIDSLKQEDSKCQKIK